MNKHLFWLRPLNIAFVLTFALAVLFVGAGSVDVASVQSASYWMAAALLLRMPLHELGHLSIGLAYRAMVADPARGGPPRVMLRLGPRGRGWGAIIGRFSIWLSPFAIIGPGLAWVTGESRFPPHIRALHILAGPVAEAVPSTVALVAAQALPHSNVLWWDFTLGALVLQALAFLNLVAIATRVDGITALFDGAELARLCIGVSRSGYVALPLSTRRTITLISAAMVFAISGAELLACGLPAAHDLARWGWHL